MIFISRILENEVKNAILHYDNLLGYLGDLGDTKIIYEKAIDYHHVIADSLIFTENMGVIGIEIKTEYDTIRRLEKQLDSYLKSCTYVFVFCHDSHVSEVEKLLQKTKFSSVGIISYDTFDDKVIAGLYKKAGHSPYYSLKVLASMLWRRELYGILQVWWAHPDEVSHNTYDTRIEKSKGIQVWEKRVGIFNHKSSFYHLLNVFCNTFSAKQGTRVICEVFLKNAYDPKKQLQEYKFNDDFEGDITFKIKYKK